ncbi:type IV / VI secretion system protein DotU [Herbaspirillum rubrisubalbicans M1]|uniref:DotU family type IV/VI secretion system protein n=1 Tax=Herbaspirillum rubrisubalbicans TaxID=80842 RepID=UPI00073A55AF|nr:DotU family type IV/VI secretion system protein [Herbaspirillum rubrisubalbicans]ALU89505.1 type IV / VI secretion system protein DotU [Herbaspirillum rubrisubalbicans M1]
MNQAPIPQWTSTDAAPAASGSVLLASFTAFYEELAAIRRCQRAGTLAAYLAPDGASLSAPDYATRTAARLLRLMREQYLAFRRQGSAQQIKMHNTTLYLMAALADEVLLLELSWPGAEHWFPVLLENQMFKTRHSGQMFFELADKLIAGGDEDPLRADLASVFLLTLQLGFKGQHRTPEGAKALERYCHVLFRIADGGARRLEQPAPSRDTDWQHSVAGIALPAPGFVQAYQHNITDGQDLRLAPVSRWRRAMKLALLGYLILSTLIWIVLLYPPDHLWKP